MGFHFEENRESILGMYKKIVFLDENGFGLKNILLVLDRELLGVTLEKSGIFDRISPIYNKKFKQLVAFYLDHVKVYFDPKFFIPLYINKITGNYYGFMEGMIDPNYPGLDHNINQIKFDIKEKILI